jgi:acyl carrier protein
MGGITKNEVVQSEVDMNDQDAVREFVGSLLLRKGDLLPFEDTDSLVLSGRLDSLDVLEIVVFLEKTYAFDFGDRPFDQQLVDSVDEIKDLIAAA